MQTLDRAVLETEARLQNLAAQRQKQLLGRQRTALSQAQAWYVLTETHPSFLSGLLDSPLRQAVVSALSWADLRSGKGLQQLLRLLALVGLIELNLQDCRDVTDTQIIAMVQNSPELVSLNVSGCVQLTSKAISQCALSASSLLRLSARQLPLLTDLWRGALWLTSTALVFPRLTHVDF